MGRPLDSVRALSVAAAIAAGLVLFALSTRTDADPDLWGHLRFGLDTLQTSSLTAADPYSFTQDRPWINHEWFSEWQMAVAYSVAGIAGLTLLKAALVFSALWIVWSSLRRTDLIVRTIAMGVVVVGTGSITSTLRPQLWSLLLLTILCRTLAAADRRTRWLVPLLFVMWANIHGGWIVGLGVLGAWATADVWLNRRHAASWFAIVGVSVAATLATPYGTSLWFFLWDTVGVTRPITEWQPLFLVPTMNWLPVVIVSIAAIWVLSRPSPHRLHAALVMLMLAYGSLRVSRIGPLFVASAGILMAPALASRWPVRPLVLSPMPSPAVIIATVGLLLLSSVAASAWIASSSLGCIRVQGPWVAPADGARLLARASPGRVVTAFDWGEYAIWHLGPNLRVSMDGRRETVYSDARLAEHDAILDGAPAGLSALETWRAEYVWLPARSVATKAWLATHGYRIELDTPESFVAVRDDLPRLPTLAAVAQPPQRCFPD